MPAKSSKKGNAPLLAEGLIRSAEEAGLRYVSDWKRGITRKRNGKGFSYSERRRRRQYRYHPRWREVRAKRNTAG